MRSLKFRLASGILVSVSVVFIILWLAASHSIRVLVEEQMSTRLLHDSEALLARLQFNNNGQLQLDTAGIGSIYERPFSGHYFAIQYAGTRIRSRSLWDNDLILAPASTTASMQSRIQGPQQQPLLAVHHLYRKQGKTISISVAEDLTNIEKQISYFRIWFGSVALLVLLLLVLMQVYTVHINLKPLQRTRQQIHELESGNRDHLDNNVPAELRPLVDEINHLLQRISQRLQRSRNALGDLAHALKKPLTVLTQISADSRLHQYQDIKQQIEYQNSAIKRTIDHVLKRARLAGDGHAISQFSLTRDLGSLLDTLATMYPDKTIQPSLTVGDHDLIPFDREDMMELLGNLLDNACKWAQHYILFNININKDIHIRIQDDGPGIDEKAIDKITARGARLDESTLGHGLGLAIVADIIELYHGDINFTRNVAGNDGLCVDIYLSLKQDSAS